MVYSPLRLRCIDWGHVDDALVMPRISYGNINSTCLMVGEKAADLILADHAT